MTDSTTFPWRPQHTVTREQLVAVGWKVGDKWEGGRCWRCGRRYAGDKPHLLEKDPERVTYVSGLSGTWTGWWCRDCQNERPALGREQYPDPMRHHQRSGLVRRRESVEALELGWDVAFDLLYEPRYRGDGLHRFKDLCRWAGHDPMWGGTTREQKEWEQTMVEPSGQVKLL